MNSLIDVHSLTLQDITIYEYLELLAILYQLKPADHSGHGSHQDVAIYFSL